MSFPTGSRFLWVFLFVNSCLLLSSSLAQTRVDWSETMREPVHHPHITGVVTEMVDDLLFVAGSNLEIWDVSDIQDPVLLSELELDGSVEELLHHNGLIFIRSNSSGVVVYNIVDPANPVFAADYFVQGNTFSNMCVAAGHLAVLDAQFSIHLLDLGENTLLDLVSLTENATTHGGLEPIMQSMGSQRIICSYDESLIRGFIVWDFSSPLQPVQTASQEVGCEPYGGFNICVVEDKVYGISGSLYTDCSGWDYYIYYLHCYLVDDAGLVHLNGQRRETNHGTLQYVSNFLITTNGDRFFVTNPENGRVIYYFLSSGEKSISGTATRFAVCSADDGLKLWEENLFSFTQPLGRFGNYGYGSGEGDHRVSFKHSFCDQYFYQYFYTHFRLFDRSNQHSTELVCEGSFRGSGSSRIGYVSKDWIFCHTASEMGYDPNISVMSTKDCSTVLDLPGGATVMNGSTLWHFDLDFQHLDSYFLDPTFGAVPMGSFQLDYSNIQEVALPAPGLLVLFNDRYQECGEFIFLDISRPDEINELGRIPVESIHSNWDPVYNSTHLFYVCGSHDGIGVVNFVDPENPVDLGQLYSGDFIAIKGAAGRTVTVREQGSYRVFELSADTLVPVSPPLPFDYSKLIWDGNLSYHWFRSEIQLHRWNGYHPELIGRAFSYGSWGSLEIHDGQLFAGEYSFPLHSDFYTPITQLTIDVSPGQSDNLYSCQNNSQTVSVAILADQEIDVATLVRNTARFGPAEALPLNSQNGSPGQLRDLNRDGRPDLLLEFSSADTGIRCGDTSVNLSIQLPNGATLWGNDQIRTVGESTNSSDSEIRVSCSPNPFNPRVTIALNNRRAQQATLTVFDLHGRRVAVVFKGLLPVGENIFVWEGTDGRGHDAPSGRYFLRMESEESIQTEKLLLLR